MLLIILGTSKLLIISNNAVRKIVTFLETLIHIFTPTMGWNKTKSEINKIISDLVFYFSSEQVIYIP